MSTVFNNQYAGTGMSFSSDYYMRNFYISNRDAGTNSKRSAFTSSELSLADSMALRRAVKNLGSFDYTKSQSDDMRNSVLAFMDTYNNLLDSAGNVSSDASLDHAAKQLKALTSEHAKELDKIGITVNSDGTLTSRENLFKSADISKFEKLFSEESDYMQQASAYAKKLARRSEELVTNELYRSKAKTGHTPKIKQPEEDGPSAGETPSKHAAKILDAGIDLDVLLNTGIGSNVNLTL